METAYNEGYKNLPFSLTRHGLTLRQIKRNAKAAIYSVGGRGREVFKVKLNKAWTVKDKAGNPVTVEAAEGYPSDEDFGKIAWYYMPGQEHVAERKFEELSNANPA